MPATPPDASTRTPTAWLATEPGAGLDFGGIVMKAVRVHKCGGSEALVLEELPLPEPGPGQARVRVKAAGLNYIDVYQRTGLYPLGTPFTPGQEGAGVVDAVGEGVAEVQVGDRVAYAMAAGSYAEYAVVPAWRLVRLPGDVSFETGAAIMLQGMTAHYLSHSTFPLREGHRILAHAAAGGVGLLLVQIAKKRGATVYGTVGTQEKARLVRDAGADAAILYTEVDFAEEVRRLSGGEGVHVVYDSVGQATFEKSLKCLAPRGYLVSFGQSSGKLPPVDTQVLSAHGSLFLTRPTLAHYTLTREELTGRAGDLFAWIAGGQLQIRIDSTFPLERAADAHRRIESRQSAGKILLIP